MKSFSAIAAVITAIATALVLTSCTSPAGTSGDGHNDPERGAESSSSQAGGFNDADVAFTTGMIPHHQQAVELSALVPSRSTDPAVIMLAAEISAAQAPEIDTMKGFLVQWNKSPGVDEGHGMEDMQMQGMVDDSTMTRLESLKGNEFDKLWLSSMIGHHEGAIGMADTELADGANADAKELARQIIAAQKAEVDQMKQMVG